MSKLLIDEPPLQIIPSLAVEIGLNEAIFIQQLHYWIARSKTDALGCKWVYNTAAEWKTQFPFWSENTIRRTIESLREKKLISTVKLNANKHDHTLYFTICYDNLPDRSTQNGYIDTPKMSTSDIPKMATSSLSENTAETTTENKKPKAKSLDADYLISIGVDSQIAHDHMILRKAKRSPLTQTALDSLINAFSKSGFSPPEGFAICAKNGWVGFKQEWLNNQSRGQSNGQSQQPPIDNSAAGRVRANIARDRAAEAARANQGFMANDVLDVWPQVD
jgi:hypothetical protein